MSYMSLGTRIQLEKVVLATDFSQASTAAVGYAAYGSEQAGLTGLKGSIVRKVARPISLNSSEVAGSHAVEQRE